MSEIVRITTARAILDWINRPKTLADAQAEQQFGDQAGQPQAVLPGVVGRTRFRVTWELDARTAPHLVRKMEQALEDPALSESMRDAIAHTRKQILRDCAQFFEKEKPGDGGV